LTESYNSYKDPEDNNENFFKFWKCSMKKPSTELNRREIFSENFLAKAERAH
jgi:hypothetical protein